MKLILLTSLIDLPVASIDDQKKVGVVKQSLIDLKKGKLMGVLVKENIFSKPKYISLEDIAGIENVALIVNKESDVVPLEDVIRAKELHAKGIKLIGLPAKTKSNKKIGKITDVAISLENGLLIKIYVSSTFRKQIIPRTNIIEFTPKAVIIDDDTRLYQALPAVERI